MLQTTKFSNVKVGGFYLSDIKKPYKGGVLVLHSNLYRVLFRSTVWCVFSVQASGGAHRASPPADVLVLDVPAHSRCAEHSS